MGYETFHSKVVVVKHLWLIRLPGAVFCIEFGWGWTKLIIVLCMCMNLLVDVEIRWHSEFGRI